jgi:hypothetical protein
MTDVVEQRQMVTRAVDMLQAEGFDVSCDPGLLDPSLPPSGDQGLSLGDRLSHLTQSIRSAAHTGEVVAALSELTAPGDGVLQRLVESLNTTADWWEGLGEPADPHYANRLRYIAKKLDSYALDIRSMRGELADRHTDHPTGPRPEQSGSHRRNQRCPESPPLSRSRQPHGARPLPRHRQPHLPPCLLPGPRPHPVADRCPARSPPCPAPAEPSPPSTPARPLHSPDGPAMPTPEHDLLPDVAVGRHPDFGIVASNPKHLAASAWMLKGFDFHPVPDHPNLYALANQQHDGQGRATRAVALLRKAGYRVDVDAAFDPSPASGPAPARDRPPRLEPDVAFAEHPELGVVAATADGSSARGGPLILEEHGWRHNPGLDIYTLPITTDRSEALDKVATATLAMHRSDLHVAVQPLLVQDVTARYSTAPTTVARHQHSQGFTTHKLPMNAAALAASPARAGLPGQAPIATPAASGPAARQVDPRIAFSRNR